jgi:hypothetical protein
MMVVQVPHEGRFSRSRLAIDPVDAIPRLKPVFETTTGLVVILGAFEDPLEGLGVRLCHL